MLIIATLFLIDVSFVLYYNRSPFHYLPRIFTWIVAVESLFFLNQYSRIIVGLESTINHKLRVFFSFIILPILIILPGKDWQYLNYSEIGHFSIQPLVLFVILVISSYIFIMAIKRTSLARKKILDPTLSDLYKWIYQSIISFSISLISFASMFVYSIVPPEYLEILNIITIIFFAISSIGQIIGITGFYIAMVIPKSLLKKFYQKQMPMWNQEPNNSKEPQNTSEIIERLKNALF